MKEKARIHSEYDFCSEAMATHQYSNVIDIVSVGYKAL